MNTSAPSTLPTPRQTMTWIAERTGSCTFVNDAWVAFTGISLEDQRDQGWQRCIHPDDRRALLQIHQQVLDSASPAMIQTRLRHHTDRFVPLRLIVSPRIDDEGLLTGLLTSAHSLAETRFDSMYAFAEDIFDMTLDSVCVAGFDGYFKRVNPSWVKTLGWSVEELMQRPILDFVHPDDREAVLRAREHLYQGTHLQHLVNRYLCKDGSYRWMQWKSVSHPERKLVYAVARDISEQKRTEEALRAARAEQQELQRQLLFSERMASVGTLAAGVAHEINNPLTYVTTNIDLLQQELSNHRDALHHDALAHLHEMADEARAGAERIRKIVRGLKTFSRSDDERRAIIDPLPLLEMSINMAANEFRHRARLITSFAPLPLVEADDARLGQVFINLLVNAAQALPDDDDRTHEIRVLTKTDPRGRAHIAFQDTGQGIAPAILERIFDPFFTTKPVGVGTGLGLSICHTIITALGGELTVESIEGQGATFTVVLPPASTAARVAPPAPLTNAPRTEPESTSQPGARVLVVDDEPAIGRVFKRALRGHTVDAVTSAEQALACLEAGQHFDIIFSDLMMPRVSGMELFDAIQRRFPELAHRVVFITGGTFTARARDFLDAIENPALEKPFDLLAIHELVVRYAANHASP